MKDLIHYPPNEVEWLNTLDELVHDRELKYRCTDLYKAGVEDETELLSAIRHANQSLFRSGLNPHHYIKPLFVTAVESGQTYHDWKMSAAGFLLVLFSANQSSRKFNRFKIALINRLLEDADRSD
ncbi:hypothetical protein [uncultured Sunxiuqinia sp.]|uniref:hypothetical protein n=1 Tax=uncultured Sunxiuqinia sp. TaxID=1573825 RepID=UPI00260ED8DC|nr:hypothetical protein [uncultured Sunxiuqinia sp.]